MSGSVRRHAHCRWNHPRRRPFILVLKVRLHGRMTWLLGGWLGGGGNCLCAQSHNGHTCGRLRGLAVRRGQERPEQTQPRACGMTAKQRGCESPRATVQTTLGETSPYTLCRTGFPGRAKRATSIGTFTVGTSIAGMYSSGCSSVRLYHMGASLVHRQ